MLWASPINIPCLGVSLDTGEKVTFLCASHFGRSRFSPPQSGFTGRIPSAGKELRAASLLSFQSGVAGIKKWQTVKTPYLEELV